MNTHLTAQQVSAVALMLADEDDEQLRLDMLEGSTDLFEIITALLNDIEGDEGNATILKAQEGQRAERRKAAEHRIAKRREAIMALMQCAGIEKLPLPEATLSVRRIPPKPIVSDEAAVPDDLCRFKKAPDMAAIKAEVEAGRAVSGVTLDNGGMSLTIRRN